MMIARKMEKMELGIGKLFDQTFLAENLTLWFDADKKRLSIVTQLRFRVDLLANL